MMSAGGGGGGGGGEEVVVVVVYFTSQILTGKLPNNKKAKAKKIILIKEITGGSRK